MVGRHEICHELHSLAPARSSGELTDEDLESVVGGVSLLPGDRQAG